MKQLLLAATILAGAALPARATLQLAFNIGGDPFFCADNTACDTNPAVGILAIGDQTIDGVTVNGSIQQSIKGPGLDFLNTSSLSIINTNAAPVAVAAAVSDTDFTSPDGAVVVGFAGAGTWQNALGSTTTLGWFVDPANAQGAATATDTPGTEVGTFSTASTFAVDSFSDAKQITFPTGSPFSMTLSTSGILGPGAALISRGQDIAATPVPEPRTWAMFIIGLGLMAGFGFKRRVKDRLAQY